jgi:multisubunit Na+/H+ antiporter MnhB subunit
VRLTPPAQSTWLLALILGLVGILIRLGALRFPGLGFDAFWLVVLAFALLVIAPVAKRI